MILKYGLAYILTGVSFAIIDSVWLRNMYVRLYQDQIGEVLMKGVRMGPAVTFYLLYILGIIVFAFSPALASGKWQTALVNGAMFGFFCYMTYDLTNYSTLKVWSLKVTILDMIWGTVLTGLAATAGYWLTTSLTGFFERG
jgi:uncharacterized membrane protein